MLIFLLYSVSKLLSSVVRRLVCSAVVSPKATSYCEKTEYDDEPGCVLSTV